jgi:ABC-type transporter MlaC component
MTKVELEDFVREVYATYNQTFYEAEREYVLRAWWNLLKDLEDSEVRAKFLKMAVVAKTMPTPGALRRAVVESKMDDIPPTAYEAWAQLQRLIQDINQGTHHSSNAAAQMHGVLTETIKALGAVAYSLSTNRDRDYFTTAYNEKLADFYSGVYSVDGD